jgi:peroxidase
MDLLPPDEIESQISSCALSKAVTGIDPPPEVKCFKAGEMNKQFRIENSVKIILFLNENNTIL